MQTPLGQLILPNPLIVGSGPPTVNGARRAKFLNGGWGGVVAKTLSRNATTPNVTPCYRRWHMELDGIKESWATMYGHQNIELISTEGFGVWRQHFRKLRGDLPHAVLIASVMEPPQEAEWAETIAAIIEDGASAIELNCSCPHGFPERKMGAAIGEDPDILHQVCEWAVRAAKGVDVYAKLTPNVGSAGIRVAAEAAFSAGANVSLTNTFHCIGGVDWKKLTVVPNVNGRTMTGGYSGPAIFPQASALVRLVAELRNAQYTDRKIMGLGGVWTAEDVATMLAFGADAVQLCTRPQYEGVKIIDSLLSGLQEILDRSGLTIETLKGWALGKVTTHAELLRGQPGRTDGTYWSANPDDETQSVALV